MITIDTDVLAVYFIFRWDSKFGAARAIVDSEKLKATTVINALELAGLMSIALSGVKTRELFLLHRRRDFRVLYWRSWLEQPAFVPERLSTRLRGGTPSSTR